MGSVGRLVVGLFSRGDDPRLVVTMYMSPARHVMVGVVGPVLTGPPPAGADAAISAALDELSSSILARPTH